MPTAMNIDAGSRTWSDRFSGSGSGTVMGSGIATGTDIGIMASSGSVSAVGSGLNSTGVWLKARWVQRGL